MEEEAAPVITTVEAVHHEEETAPVITTVEGVLRDFKRRQSALIKALTSDAQQFFQLCDPEKGENLCLFGLPNEAWEVKPPADLVPPDLPEPTSGINIARDEMNKRDWLLMVAALSDSWLLAVAFFYCGLIGFDKNERNELFEMIDDRPTVYEHVENDFSEVICGGCGGTNGPVDNFWICCDVCEVWFHGVCVKITPAKAEHLKKFKCPGCTSNRLRPQ